MHQHRVRTWSLTVDGNHTFFVGDGDGNILLVHNADEWHHLLPKAFVKDHFGPAKIDVNSAEYGWIIDWEAHRGKGGLHSEGWNKDWDKFFKSYSGKPQREQIIAQLDAMKKKYKAILDKGAQATMSYDDWGKGVKTISDTLDEIKSLKNGKGIVRKATRVIKGVGVVIVIYDFTTKEFTVAAENTANELCWPVPQMARAAAEIGNVRFQNIVNKGLRANFDPDDPMSAYLPESVRKAWGNYAQ